MSEIPPHLKYTKEHEWIDSQNEDSFNIGITDHAQDSLGDVTFVELPEIGSKFTKGAVFGVVESVKAASDLYMPVGGEVLEINDKLADSPELLNQSPYVSGWLVKIKPDSNNSLGDLLSATQYEEEIR